MSLATTKKGVIYARSYAFEWRIRNYSVDDKRVGDSVISPVFFDRWSIRLYPKNEKAEKQNHLSVYVHNERDEATQASSKIHILGKRNEKLYTCSIGTNRFEEKGVFPSAWGCTVSSCTRDDVLRKCLIDDTLAILCEINMERDVDFCIETGRSVSALEDYETLLDNDCLSDVSFLIGKDKIRAHKAVLSARNSVFRAMFAHDVKENSQNTVDIEGIEPAIFNELLRFLYAGRVREIDAIAELLLLAADRYAIDELVKMCENVLIRRLSAANAIEYLKLADSCNVPNLRKRIGRYIALNSEEFVDHQEFQSLVHTHPDIFLEVTRSLLKNIYL